MTKILNLFVFILFFIKLNASPQIPDYLIYDGKTVELFTNPLEQYLEMKGQKEIDRGCNSSACSRGYTAVWELKEGKLYLVEIKPCGIIAVAGVFTGLECGENKDSAVLNYLNNEFKTKNRFADWYTGELLSPQGRLINYMYMGYDSTYEKEKHFKIKKGVLLKTELVENEVKPELYDVYNRSLVIDTLFHSIAKLDWKKLEEKYVCIDEYSFKINKKGKVSKVWYESDFDSKWEKFWYNVNDFGCRRRLRKSVKHLNFKRYLKGKPKEIIVHLNLDLYKSELRLLN